MKKIMEKIKSWSTKKKVIVGIILLVVIFLCIPAGDSVDDSNTTNTDTTEVIVTDGPADEDVEVASVIPEDAQGVYEFSYMELDGVDMKIHSEDFYLLEAYGLTEENSKAFKSSNFTLLSDGGIYTFGNNVLTVDCNEYPDIEITGGEDYDIYVNVIDKNNIEISYAGDFKIHYEK